MYRTLAAALGAVLAIAAGDAAGQEFESGHLLVTGSGSAQIREFDLHGTLVREIAPQNLQNAVATAFGPTGHLFVVHPVTGSILQIDPAGQKISEFGAGAGLSSPRGIAFGPAGRILVTSANPDRVVEFDSKGVHLRDLGTDAGLSSPDSIAVGPSGTYYISSRGNHKIVELDPAGAKIREITDIALVSPASLFFGADGKLNVLSTGTAAMLVFERSGALERSYGLDSGWAAPTAACQGPDGNIYVTDGSQKRIYILKSQGTKIRHIDGAFLTAAPQSITVSPVRFALNITGARTVFGGTQGLYKEKAVLSVFPGSQVAMIQLTDQLKQSRDLASLFGSDVLVFRGSDRFVNAAPVARNFAGHQGGRPEDGYASISLQSAGVIDNTASFSPMIAKGSLHRGSADTGYAATFSTIKRLN